MANFSAGSGTLDDVVFSCRPTTSVSPYTAERRPAREVSEESHDNDSAEFDNSYPMGISSLIKNLPPGYRFRPTDAALIVQYLKRKIMNEPPTPHQIMSVNLYRHTPDFLAEKYKDFGEKEWYFFTPRDRKYKNGNRPNRRVGDHGGWKATGAEKDVKVDGTVVGHKKTLVYYTKYPPASNADKSSWIMQEYRIVNSTASNRGRNDMRLDDWVLCKLYQRPGRSISRPSSQYQDQEQVDSAVFDPTSPHNDEHNEPETNSGFHPRFGCTTIRNIFRFP